MRSNPQIKNKKYSWLQWRNGPIW